MPGDPAHWRRPRDGDPEAWIAELRERTHELHSSLLAIRNLADDVAARVAAFADHDRLEEEITRRLRERGALRLDWTTKLIGIGLVVLQMVTMVRGWY